MGGQLLFVFSAFLGGGSLLGGVLSDRIGRWQVLALGLGLLSPSYWFFMNTINSDMQVILLSIMGILVGLTFPLVLFLRKRCGHAVLG